GGGLNRLQNGKITTYDTKNGLFDDVVFETLEDGQGNMWMSSNKGIFRVNKQELNDLANGKNIKIHSYSYGVADGMKASECNGANFPAGLKTSKGQLWFPTIEGITVIDPDHLPLNRQLPPVVIEEVQADGSPILNVDKPASLGPGLEKFEFRYAAL